jgi:hypothetical protein
MSWATHAIAELKAGREVTIHPRGPSMRGRVESGQTCRIAPAPAEIEIGAVVLCKVKGKQYLHLVKARQGNRYLIGNNVGGINGWIGRNGIFGVLIE